MICRGADVEIIRLLRAVDGSGGFLNLWEDIACVEGCFGRGH